MKSRFFPSLVRVCTPFVAATIVFGGGVAYADKPPAKSEARPRGEAQSQPKDGIDGLLLLASNGIPEEPASAGKRTSPARFDMRDFSDEDGYTKLFGRSTEGNDTDAKGLLASALERTREKYLIFYNVERAHPAILRRLEEILTTGKLGTGNQANGKHTEALFILRTSDRNFYRELAARHASPDSRLSTYEEPNEQAGNSAAPAKPRSSGVRLVRYNDDNVPATGLPLDARDKLIAAQFEALSSELRLHGAEIKVDEKAHAALRNMASRNSGRSIHEIFDQRVTRPVLDEVGANSRARAKATVHVGATPGLSKIVVTSARAPSTPHGRLHLSVDDRTHLLAASRASLRRPAKLTQSSTQRARLRCSGARSHGPRTTSRNYADERTRVSAQQGALPVMQAASHHRSCTPHEILPLSVSRHDLRRSALRFTPSRSVHCPRG